MEMFDDICHVRCKGVVAVCAQVVLTGGVVSGRAERFRHEIRRGIGENFRNEILTGRRRRRLEHVQLMPCRPPSHSSRHIRSLDRPG